jgi:5-(carboxyamino)imidazole ribonucleotide mutase
MNAAILAAEMIALADDEEVAKKVDAWKAGLGAKIEKAKQGFG